MHATSPFDQARTEAWGDAFPAEFSVPPYTTVYAFLTYRLPAPKVGDAEALADVLDRTEKMAGRWCRCSTTTSSTGKG